MLKINNLWVKAEGKEILRGVNLRIKEGEIHALLGPNASGKTTLGFAIAGLPQYKITAGKILFENQEITNLSPEERTRLGITLAFQYPPIIRGVKLENLLEKISKKKAKIVPPQLLNREVNLNFSGGERKLSEIAQIIALKPKFVIFDELDSGLDIENLEKLTILIKKNLLKDKVSILLISHHGEIFHFLKPNFAHVMLRGKIIHSSKDIELVWQTIKKYGYERCKKCPFLSD